MAVTTLVVADISRSGIVPTLAAANADGSVMPNTGREFVMVTNGDAVPHTVTAAITKTVDGVTPAGKSITIAAGATKLFGPFKPEEYNNASAQVALTFDAVINVTIQALRLTSV